MGTVAWRSRASVLLALLLAGAGCAPRGPAPVGKIPSGEPPELAAVRRYLADEEPPERFGTERLPVRIRGFALFDLDGDAIPEVIVWTDPWYRQSPTITLFAVERSGKVRRLVEGLAPGPLVATTGAQRDSHSNGFAVDITDSRAEALRAQGTPLSRQETDAFGRAAVAAALRGAMHAVQYPSFVHTDGRIGTGSYLDLSQERGAFAEGTRCEGLEFAPVEDVAVGPLGDDPTGRYIAAAAGGRLDLYRIDRVQADGTLLKRRWTTIKPANFVRFVGAPGTPITYETPAGERVVLPTPRPN